MIRKYAEERIGERYGNLVITGYDHMGKYRSYYKCHCDCGNDCVIALQNMTCGKTKSCGCLRKTNHRGHTAAERRSPITEKCAAWLIKHFKHTKNDDIVEKWNISHSQLHRFARAHGLTKSRQFRKDHMEKFIRSAEESHRRNGTWPQKGYIIPRSAENYFKPGVTNLERYGAKKEAERARKSAETMRKTRADEQLRSRWGLHQRTKLRVIRQPTAKNNLRYRLRKRGYIIARGSSIAYYDENTNRSSAIESRKLGDKHYFYFDFKPLERCTQKPSE